MVAAQIFYTGHVQGVGFRYSVKQIASGFEVSGYVRNLMDGRVECLIQGDNAEVKAMKLDIQNSHLNGFIKKVEEHQTDFDMSIRGFEIAK
ncbi:MAG: acylphosphatase [Verrucomicrobiota bacterium]